MTQSEIFTAEAVRALEAAGLTVDVKTGFTPFAWVSDDVCVESAWGPADTSPRYRARCLVGRGDIKGTWWREAAQAAEDARGMMDRYGVTP